MYTDQTNGGFDQNGGLVQVQVQTEDGFSRISNCNNTNNNNPSFSMEDQSCNNNPQIPLSQQDHVAAFEMEFQQQLSLEMDQQCNYTNTPNNGSNNDIQEVLVNDPNWQEMASFQPAVEYPQNGHHHFMNGSSLPETPYPTTPDLLNIFPFARCSPLPNSSITLPNQSQNKPSSFLASLGLLGELNPSGAGGDGSGGVVYDPLLPLNLPPQPPLLRELFHSLPHGGYTSSLGGPRNNNGSASLFGGVDERENNGNGVFENGVFDFTAGEIDCLGKHRDGKDTKHFATERHRRVLLNDKYTALRKLIPNPTKNDRASTVGDAINYINELKRTVTELQVLVEKKRCARERLKRPKTEDESVEGSEPKCLGDMDNPYNGSPLRSSWLHRKSKNTEVDVRIVDDEVTVKLVQQKRINCLLFVSKVLDEFQLDLHHVAGGLIGDYYSFLFNSKICEGSIVYASAVANKLIEVVDKQYAAILPTSSY